MFTHKDVSKSWCSLVMHLPDLIFVTSDASYHVHLSYYVLQTDDSEHHLYGVIQCDSIKGGSSYYLSHSI